MPDMLVYFGLASAAGATIALYPALKATVRLEKMSGKDVGAALREVYQDAVDQHMSKDEAELLRLLDEIE